MCWHLAAVELYQFSVLTSQGNSKILSSCLKDAELVSISFLKKKQKRHVGTCRLETCGQSQLVSFYYVHFQRTPKNLAAIKEVVIRL